MAEAAEAGGTESGGGRHARFYCHKCSLQILPVLPELLCPVCRGGFIEEMSDAVGERREGFAHVWANVLNRGNSSRLPMYLFNHIFTNLLESANTSGLGNLQGNGFIMPLHGNPGDYAWGHSGLDAVISNLLNQLDGAGPAPLTRQQIDAIPEMKISSDQVKSNLQCSVCMEDFTLDEIARRLECGHCFHANCITPWLQIHATCPICRLQLTKAAGGQGGNNPSTTTTTTSNPGHPGGATSTGTPSAFMWGDANSAPSLSSSSAPTSSSSGATTRPATFGSRFNPGAPSTSGAIQRRPATYQEDDCD